MHEDRDVELGRELKERPGVVVVRKGAAVARINQDGAQVVLLHGALQLAQQVVAAARDRGGNGDDLVLVAVAQRRQIFVRRPDRRQRLIARIGLEIVARVRDHADVEADLVMQPQHVLDRRRKRPLLLARRMHMRMPVDDHGPAVAAITVCGRNVRSPAVQMPGNSRAFPLRREERGARRRCRRRAAHCRYRGDRRIRPP